MNLDQDVPALHPLDRHHGSRTCFAVGTLFLGAGQAHRDGRQDNEEYPGWGEQRDHGISRTFPVVLRLSRSRWACAASLSGNSAPIRSLSFFSRIHPNTSLERLNNSSRLAM